MRKQNYRHLSCEYMRQVSSHVPSYAPLSLLAATLATRPPAHCSPSHLQGGLPNKALCPTQAPKLLKLAVNSVLGRGSRLLLLHDGARSNFCATMSVDACPRRPFDEHRIEYKHCCFTLVSSKMVYKSQVLLRQSHVNTIWYTVIYKGRRGRAASRPVGMHCEQQAGRTTVGTYDDGRGAGPVGGTGLGARA
eukprot:COSAG06_NODE_24364_length_665_cov_0.763251_1_plen_192_part_00